jgi:gamma-glutamyl:cysteine ligase YbdK (ATP-grasp superfamily)
VLLALSASAPSSKVTTRPVVGAVQVFEALPTAGPAAATGGWSDLEEFMQTLMDACAISHP